MTVERWTEALPQITSIYMAYGHDNSDDVDIGLDPEAHCIHKILLQRSYGGDWETAKWYKFPKKEHHRLPTMFQRASR